MPKVIASSGHTGQLKCASSCIEPPSVLMAYFERLDEEEYWLYKLIDHWHKRKATFLIRQLRRWLILPTS